MADDKPNQNKQGIKAEDFDDVIKSAIDMPVKMNFTKRNGVQNHLGSIPIGHIKTVDKNQEGDIQQLVATAVLYADEYPEEIQFLRDAFASGNSPGISYEMAYADSVTEDGNQWLKQLITLAATFVKTPAYGSRTALLALASAGEISLKDLAKEIMLLAKAEEKEGIITDKGGNDNVDEKELQELKDRLSKAEAQVTTFTTEAATKDQTISDLQAQLVEKDTTLKTLNDEKAAILQAQLIDARVRKLAEAGITLEADAEKANKKKEFWASLSEENFEEYVSDLLTAKKAAQPNNKIALASLNGLDLPKPDVTTTDVSAQTLLQHVKGLGRN